MGTGVVYGAAGSMLFGFIEVKPVVDLQGLIVPAAILVGVLLVFSDFIKPALSWLGSKAKTLVPSVSTTEPAELSASDRVQLWEQLYAACDPKHGACPKARELLNGVFPHLAPYHAEDAK